jgi:hypothetical protein
VINAVVHPLKQDHESTLIASKILIKLLIDIYCTEIDGMNAAQILLALLFEMLSSSLTENKVHAFNLIFNLSVHINLLEEISILDESDAKGNHCMSLL